MCTHLQRVSLLIAICGLGTAACLTNLKPPDLPPPPASIVADQLGPVAFKLVLATKTELKDSNKQKWATDVMKQVTDAAEQQKCKKEDWQLRIVEGAADASAFPGGGVMVTTDLLTMAEREPTPEAAKSMLAVPIAHEVAHVCAGHFALRLAKEAELFKKIVKFTRDNPDFAAKGFPNELRGPIFALLGAAHEFKDVLPFVFDHEKIADATGVKLMAAGGFTTSAAVSFWKEMKAGRASSFSLTHPNDDQRIAYLSTMVALDAPKAVEVPKVEPVKTKGRANRPVKDTHKKKPRASAATGTARVARGEAHAAN